MALVFREGFDTYNGIQAEIGLQSCWLCGSTGAQAMAAGRFAGQCWQGRNQSGTIQATAQRFFTGGSLSFSAGFAFKADVVNSLGTPVFFRVGQFRIGINTSGFLTVNRDATQIAISTTSEIVSGAWYYIEAEVIMSGTVGTVTVYKNGNPVLGLNGLTGLNTGTTIPDHVLLDTTGANASNIGRSFVYFDDIYVTDTNVRLGERRVETLYAISDGATLTLVPSTGVSHFGVVDETQANNTDWLAGTAVGDLSLLGLGNLSSTPAVIDEVNVIMYARKTDASSRALNAGIKSGGADGLGTQHFQAASFLQYNTPFPLDPNGNVAWTPAAVNALELQPRVAV